MLYCPQCGTEYREGYSSCSDCHTLLVRERPKLNRQISPSLGDFRVIWRGLDQDGCVNVCYKLQDSGIPYRVQDDTGSLGRQMRFHRRYEVFVTNADYERAKSGLELEDDPPETFSEREWQQMEEPEEFEEPETPAGFELQEESESNQSDGEDSLPDTPARRDAYFRDWYPEDATVKVWPQSDTASADDFSWGIEMGLKENLIHCRVDGDGGDKAVFVLPEDEARAREIVREIIGGTPLQ